ncbi:MAG: single-stranded DNA-binding protein [Chloroflexota bacterium]|nr:single-stranded DNA-binding protein [Chloroflexota bacterium]
MVYSKTTIVGHLGRDPELRYTPSGAAVCSFTVATNRRWTGQDGEQQEKTTWFRVTAWRKLAELCNQYLSKGRLVLVEGDIEASAWTSQDGEARASLELTARNVRFLGGRDMVGQVPGQMAGDQEAPTIDEEEIPF